MSKLVLFQGGVTATLSNVSYRPAEGFQVGNTWHVSDETLLAESDTKLANGPATIKYCGMDFPVTVTLIEFETLPGEEDEEGEPGEPACTVEIEYADGLPKLALALGLPTTTKKTPGSTVIDWCYTAGRQAFSGLTSTARSTPSWPGPRPGAIGSGGQESWVMRHFGLVQICCVYK